MNILVTAHRYGTVKGKAQRNHGNAPHWIRANQRNGQQKYSRNNVGHYGAQTTHRQLFDPPERFAVVAQGTKGNATKEPNYIGKAGH